MITYKIPSGRTVKRVPHGVLRARVLAQLAATPWRTKKELVGGYSNDGVLKRLLAKGLIKRRPRAAKWNPWEYALTETT